MYLCLCAIEGRLGIKNFLFSALFFIYILLMYFLSETLTKGVLHVKLHCGIQEIFSKNRWTLTGPNRSLKPNPKDVILNTLLMSYNGIQEGHVNDFSPNDLARREEAFFTAKNNRLLHHAG